MTSARLDRDPRRDVVAIVLVAGLGQRLEGVTHGQPKCLVEVCGRPILANTLLALKDSGIDRAVLVVGHRAQVIRDFVAGRDPEMALTFVTNADYARTGTAQSLALGLAAIPAGCPVLVVEGDVLFEPALLRAFLHARHATATVAAPYRPELTGTFVSVGPGGIITDWVHERVRPPGFPLVESSKTVNISYFSAADVSGVLAPALRRCLAEDGRTAPLEYALRRAVLDMNLRIEAVDPGERRWFEVDTPEDLEFAEAIFRAVRPSGDVAHAGLEVSAPGRPGDIAT